MKGAACTVSQEFCDIPNDPSRAFAKFQTTFLAAAPVGSSSSSGTIGPSGGVGGDIDADRELQLGPTRPSLR